MKGTVFDVKGAREIYDLYIIKRGEQKVVPIGDTIPVPVYITGAIQEDIGAGLRGEWRRYGD